MIAVVVLAFELLLLFFLSRWLSGSLFLLFHLLTRSRTVSITITTLLLFPGTVIHELSHLFTAEILQVRTGKLSLFPILHDDEYIEAGSVQVAKTDPLRRTVIGIAPLIVGSIVVTLLSHQLTSMSPNLFQQTTTAAQYILFFILGYLLFAAANNMFPSKEDMQGVPAVFIVFGLLCAASYIVGVRVTVSGKALEFIQTLLASVTTNMLIIIALNTLLYFLVRLCIVGIKKLYRPHSIRI